ncbi:guanylate kinase [Spiroplasma diminutum]|uniref:Guanylate kinase n=1 Tax=Spiroplasma diminutum CUAS-1 TaxID=1276221 RepID=S5M2T5_9MOLU|nr:guanylate kinase [Spiroplasma diminutum]AGR42397.1 guanylate kinase [Spiroplasma diminutum CUAS-1]
MNKKGKIIILSGPSGVGKGSINKELAQDKSLNLVQSISMTTRPPRPGEIEGVNYYFVDKETFKDAIQHNELIEYAEFIDNYYGTPRKTVHDKINNGENVILEIEVVGATQVLKKEKPENLVSIFLMPPSLKALEQRLRKRGTEKEEIIKQRLDKALLEIPLKHKYQYIIEIDSVENAVAKVKEVLTKENTLKIDQSQSKYFKLKNKVEQIVSEEYEFFVNNWKENVQKVGEQVISENFDFKNYLVELLTDKTYAHVLANEDLEILESSEFISTIVEHFMIDVNFFSIEQKEFKK